VFILSFVDPSYGKTNSTNTITVTTGATTLWLGDILEKCLYKFIKASFHRVAVSHTSVGFVVSQTAILLLFIS